jgi:23S rRNA pseudouridine1911/1915/1917 synthase
MRPSTLDVLYEDNHLLVVNKPAGLVVQGAAADTVSLHRLACAYLKEKYHKPGNVYLGVVSRLDRPVTGVVVFARTSKAAARLTEAFRQRQVKKVYWAVVSPPPKQPSGEWHDWLLRPADQNRTQVVRMDIAPAATAVEGDQAEGQDRGVKKASLRYRVLKTAGQFALLEIELCTGRKHQIRAQAAARGSPIVGDRQYGSRVPFPAGIALHARRLVVPHPTRKEWLTVEAPLPSSWRNLAVASCDPQ